MGKLYQDRDWLYEHYIVREESSYVMAKEAGCDPKTICRWLRKFDIPVRGYEANSLWRNRDWLYEHYIAQEESTYVIAKGERCGPNTIYYWLRKYGIPVRVRGEGIFLARRNSVVITSDLLEFMEGEIIGDGCVKMPGNRSAYYSHTSKYKKYVIWLSGRFDEWGIEQSGKITRYKNKQHGAITYCYASKSYPELVDVYKRWYPNGKKIVPPDLELTPIMARQWYLGDGGFDDYNYKHPGIVLSTCDFDQQSIEHLIKELGRLGFKATRQPSDNTIYLWVCSVQDFLKWIGPCPISCYDYKWDYSKGDK